MHSDDAYEQIKLKPHRTPYLIGAHVNKLELYCIISLIVPTHCMRRKVLWANSTTKIKQECETFTATVPKALQPWTTMSDGAVPGFQATLRLFFFASTFCCHTTLPSPHSLLSISLSRLLSCKVPLALRRPWQFSYQLTQSSQLGVLCVQRKIGYNYPTCILRQDSLIVTLLLWCHLSIALISGVVPLHYASPGNVSMHLFAKFSLFLKTNWTFGSFSMYDRPLKLLCTFKGFS